MFRRLSNTVFSRYCVVKSSFQAQNLNARPLQLHFGSQRSQFIYSSYHFGQLQASNKSFIKQNARPTSRQSDIQDKSPNPNYRYFLLAGIMGMIFESNDKGNMSEKERIGEEQIIKMIKMAALSCEKEDFFKAEQLLHVALRTAHDIQHHKAQTYIIDAMANIAYEAGDFQKAEKLFKETMRQLIADGALENSNAIIHISAKLAKLYALFEDDLKASEGFKFCVKHLDQKLKEGADDFDTLALYSLALSWYGEYLHSRGKPEESLKLFKKSHEVSLKINGPYHPHSLLQLNNMAACYSLMNQLDEAVSCLNQAISLVQEHKMDDGEYDLPFYHLNLANVYLTQLENPKEDPAQLLRKASECCQKAMRLARKAGITQVLKEAEKCLATIKHQTNEYRAMLYR